MNANFLKNAFDRLGGQDKILGEIKDNTLIMANSVTKGGDLYSRIDSLVTVLEDLVKGKKGGAPKGIGMGEALAMSVMAPTLKPIGLGLGYIVEAINKLDDNGEQKAKALESIIGTLTKLGEVGKSILVFAGYMILAIPFLLVTAAASPLILLSMAATVGAVMLVGRMLDKKTMKKLERLKSVGWGILAFVGTMALVSLIAVPAIKGTLGFLAVFGLFVLGMRLIEMIGVANPKYMEMLGKGMMHLGLGVLAFMGALAIVSFFVPQAIKGLIGFVIVFGLFILAFRLIEMIGVANPEYMEELGKGLLFLGLGILAFMFSMALVSLVGPFALKGMLWSLAIIVPILGLFWLMEYMGLNESMKDSAQALAWAAIGILAIGIAFALFNIIVPDWGAIFNTILVVGLVAAAFWLIGKGQKEIYKGAMAMIIAGVAMIVVAIAFLILSTLFPSSEMSLDTFAPLLIIGAVGVAFVLLGLGASLILQGAAAMIVAGIAVILLAVGLLILQKPLEKGGWEFIGQVGALIAMIALEFGLLGLAAPFILIGAAAMLVAGVAMIMLGAGVGVMAAVMKKGGEITKADKDGNTPMGLLIGSIGDSFNMWPWEAAGIALGAGAMVVAGMALILVGVGVKQFAKLAEEIDLVETAQNISRLIGALAVPFSVIGGGGTLTVIDPVTGKEVDVTFSGGSGGFFGLGGSNPVSMGIMAVMNMGRALTNIAGGVQSMANLKFPTGFDKDGKATGYNKINSEDVVNVSTNTAYLVGALAAPFAKIGKGGKTTIKDPMTGKDIEVDFGAPSDGGIMGFLKGGGDVQKGIAAVKNLGTTLSNLAIGVQEMAMLKMPTGFDAEGKPTGFVPFDANSAQMVTSNTEMLVGALSGTFAKIGANPDAAGDTWWGGKSNITKGIELVSGMGTPLFNLAQGVQEMANLKFPAEYDAEGNVTKWYTIKDLGTLLPKIESNSIKLISALTNVFTKLGEKKPKGRGWAFWKPTNFEKGIALVEQVGEPFQKLASAAQSAANVTKAVDDADKMHNTIKLMMDALMGIGENTNFAMLPFRIALIEATEKAYKTFETAIPAIVNATAEFKPELGKSFMSIFGGDVNPDTLPAKITMLTILSAAYGKMSQSIPKITAAIATLMPEQANSVRGLLGGMYNYAAKTAMYTVLGLTYTQMGAAIPNMTSAINSLDDHKAKIFSGIFINKEKGGLFSNKYEDQQKLWTTIGTSMMMTSIAMPKIAEGINNMDLAKLTEARTMFEALGVLANGGEAEDILAEMGESLEKAMERLADILKTFQTTVGEQTESNETIPEKIAGALGGVIGAFKDGARGGGGGGGNSAEVVSAINQLNRVLVKNGVKISNIDDL